MEKFDLYNFDRTLSGKVIERENPVPAGYYRLVVVTIVFNSKGEIFKMIDEGTFIPYNKGIIDFIFFQYDHEGTHTKKDWTVPSKE